MKHIFEYLFSKKSDLDKINSKPSIRLFDIAYIDDCFYIYLSDEYFKKINPIYHKKLTAGKSFYDGNGVFYRMEYDTPGWMPFSGYDNQLKYTNPHTHRRNADYDIVRLWRNIDLPAINRYLNKYLTQEVLHQMIVSGAYRIII